MSNLSTLLRKIVGRIKELDSLLTSFGTMLIPIALIAGIEWNTPKWIFYTLIILGFICVVWGAWENYSDRVGRRKDRIVTNALISEARMDFNKLITELKGLREDINKGQNNHKTNKGKKK